MKDFVLRAVFAIAAIGTSTLIAQPVAPPEVGGPWAESALTLLERTVGASIAKRTADAIRCRNDHFELTFEAGRITGCPEREPEAQALLFLQRLEDVRALFEVTLGFSAAEFARGRAQTTTNAKPNHDQPFAAPSTRIHVYVLRDELAHRLICPRVTGIIHQGVGTKRFDARPTYALLHDTSTLRDDAELHRNLVHNIAHLLLASLDPRERSFGHVTHGWLDAGLAHYFGAKLVEGSCGDVCYHERAQPPIRFHPSGDWMLAARKLSSRGALPPIEAILGRSTSELTPEQHVASFAFVSYLIERRGGPRLGETIRRLVRGESVNTAVELAFEASLAEIEREFTAWIGHVPAPSETPPAREARRHGAFYIYTQPFVRPRHRDVVQKAIARRAVAHESGWRIDRRKPEVELGPAKRAAHWKGDRQVKPIWAAWPFAVVFEFDQTGQPKVWLDWTRRRRNSQDVGGWFLDPAGTYVEHINAEVVCDHDDEFGYMAVVDTPTGEVMGSNEFAVRGRALWEDGTAVQRGWWVRFNTPKARRVESWQERLVPLVNWHMSRRSTRGSWSRSTSLAAEERQIGVFGQPTVFELPKIPTGMRACGGQR